MACHGGGNNRLDNQLAEPGFPEIEDHGMGSLVRAGRGGERWPEHPGGAAGNSQAPRLVAGDARSRAGPGTHGPSPLDPCRSFTVRPYPVTTLHLQSSSPDSWADDRILALPAHPGAGGAKQRGDKVSTEQTQSSFTDASPEPGPAGGRASTGLMFCLLPLSSAALGGLTVSGFIFIIAAAAFLSDRAGYGAALSVYGTVITLLPVSIVWAVLRWTQARLGPDSADMTWNGIPTPWDRHWAVVTWWTAAIATGWIVIAVLATGLPDLPPLGGSGFPTFFELLPAGLAALGATLYVAIAATAVLVIIVPVSAGPPAGTQTRLGPSGLYAVHRGGDGVHRGRGRQDGWQLGLCVWNQLTVHRDAAGPLDSRTSSAAPLMFCTTVSAARAALGIPRPGG